MPCYYPQKAYKTIDGTVSFVRRNAISNLTLPCGNCIGCKIMRSNQWGTRIYHESTLHKDNMFLTLTYDDDHLPTDESINVKHFQTFMKAYRNSLQTKIYNLFTGRENHITLQDNKIRFFHCGEYGTEKRRPHYHAIIFGHEFNDLTPWEEGLFTSEKLTALWQNGFTSIGSVTAERAKYVAKYILKKITGKPATDHYQHITRYGEMVSLTPEYITMSRRPGIASTWWEKYKDDVYPSNFITQEGHKLQVPKYYQNKYKEEQPELFEELRSTQKEQSKLRSKDNTTARLLAREQCAIARQTIRKL